MRGRVHLGIAVIVAGLWSARCSPPQGGSGDVTPPTNSGPAAPDAGPPANPDAGADAGPGDGGPSDGGVTAVEIAPYQELLVVDSSVVLDARASNATGGPWSFRAMAERLSPSGTRPGDLIEKWLLTYHQTSLNGFSQEDRAGVDELLQAWPRASDGSLDLSRAPFRLLAIVNRVDLGTSANGESRLVYGLVDPASGQPAHMTAAFEYRLPPLGTPDDRAEWARRWHALGKLSFGEAYNAALQAVTDAFTSPGVYPPGVNGSALSQLRANEARFGAIWQLREWVLDKEPAGALLRPVPPRQTPDESLNGSAKLAQFILDNSAALLAGTAVIPKELIGGASPEIGAWVFKDEKRIDEPLRHAFAKITCNGCHSAETFSSQGFFHVNPFKPIAKGGDGLDRVSVFLKQVDLPRRESFLRGQLAAETRAAVLAAAPRYDVLQVPAGEDSAPIALSGGKVLGNSSKGPWVYDGSVRYLFSGDAPQLFAMGMNARGDVAGVETVTPKVKRAWVLAGGKLSYPGTLGGGFSSANAIDAQGRAAGDSTTGGGDYHGFLLDQGGLRDIGTLGGSETMTLAVNSRGQVTGESQRADGTRHAFLYDGSAIRDLGSLGGDYAQGQAINDKGQVAGLSELVPGDHKIHAFLWDGSSMQDLGSLPGLPWTSATGLNNAGVIVGNVYNKPDYNGPHYDTFAYVYRDGVMRNLNDLIPPSTFVLLTALGVDEAGQILCTDGQVGQAKAHAYLLTPR